MVEKCIQRVDLFHNGSQIKCSSVLMLIILSRLASTRKFQSNFCFKMGVSRG